jgi:HSP20 family molecular chaperone IbpA
MASLDDNFKQRYQDVQNMYNEAQKEFDIKSRDEMTKQQQDTATHLESTNLKGKTAESELKAAHITKMENKKGEYNNLLTTKDLQYKANIKQIEIEQVRELNKLKSDHARRLLALKQDQEKEFQLLKARYTQFNKESAQDFAEKYNNIKQTNESSLHNMRSLSDSSIQKFKEANERKYAGVIGKDKDQFYAAGLLEPQIKDAGNKYEINIKVPDYDKNKVLLSGHENELKMSFSRNFADSFVESDTKATNNYSHIESYTKFFTVEEPIDHKRISQTYKDDTLTFHVPKISAKRPESDMKDQILKDYRTNQKHDAHVEVAKNEKTKPAA